MKKYLLLILVVWTGIATSCKYDDDELWGSVEDVTDRVVALETLTKQKNSDIAAMQTILNAMKNEVAVSEVENLTDGYILHFTDGTTATIKDGKDGADGEDGKDGADGADGEDGKDGADGADGADGEDGKDGADGEDGKDGADGWDGWDGKDAPAIYIAEENGIYYWTITIDGVTDWLTDDHGLKLPVVGAQAFTPLLKVSNDGYWMVSVDGGRNYDFVMDGENKMLAISIIPGDPGDASIFGEKVISKDGETITLHLTNGDVYVLAIQKPVTFYLDAEKTVVATTKETVLNGVWSVEYWYEAQFDGDYKMEVVAEDGIKVTPDKDNQYIKVEIENHALSEARAVILFFNGKKTITTVFKFRMGAWDGSVSDNLAEKEGEIYEIGSPAELAWVAAQTRLDENPKSFEGKTIVLLNDIDLNNIPWNPIGTAACPFKGKFNGNGHTISNLVVNPKAKGRAISRAAEDDVAEGAGMFGVTENATLENVTISNAQANGDSEGAAGVLVGIATGDTKVSGVTIENATATASGSESAAGLVVGKAEGSIAVSGVSIVSTPTSEGDETQNNNKVEATYAGGVVGHFDGDSFSVEETTVSGLDLAPDATSGETAAAGAVLGKVENPAGTSFTVTGNEISDVKTDVEESASNVSEGTVVGNFNEVVENNPEQAAGILSGNEVADDVEIKNKMNIESLQKMFAALVWDASVVPHYAFDIDGDITEDTKLEIPFTGYNGSLNLNFKNLTTSENAMFYLSMPLGYNAGMVVNLDFNATLGRQYVSLDMPNATVNLRSGRFGRLVASTAANTLYIADGVNIRNLEIRQGNVRVAPEGRITGSITNLSEKTVFVMLEEGATAEYNLPATENIGENIKISVPGDEVTIENTELSIALQAVLGVDRVALDENGYAVMNAADVESMTKLDFNWRGFTITNLKGIEKFVNLEELYLNSVGLKECDLSQNTAIRYIDLKWNIDLTTLDLSKNVNLETLLASYLRSLTEIKLDSCVNLKHLELYNIPLTEVTIPNPAAMQSLVYSGSKLSFDLTEFTGLTYLGIDNLGLTSLDIIPEGVKKQLTGLDCGQNQLESIDLKLFPSLTALGISNNRIMELDLSLAPQLTSLNCAGNQLTSLDLSPVTGMIYLQCYRNQLNTLDITGLSALENLVCGSQNTGKLILTLTEDQKVQWKENWLNFSSWNNTNVVLYDEFVEDAGTGGTGFGNGGKF